MKKAIGMLVVIAIIGAFAGLFAPWVLSMDDTYTGEIVFNSESEYLEFKQEVIDSDAGWDRMDILSSKPPIIVHFSVRVKQDYNFPYGEKSNNGLGLLVFSSIALLVVLAFLWIEIYEPNTFSPEYR